MKFHSFISLVIALLFVAAIASDSVVTISEEDSYRYIKSNGIPNHSHGAFPNRNNPNSISEQQHAYRVPLAPRLAGSIIKLGMHPFGVAVNGVPFDPGAAEFWRNDRSSGWQYEAKSGAVNLGLDGNNAHVQPTGAYHYHGVPTGLIDGQGRASHSKLIGYAADGFPIYALYGDGGKVMKSSYKVKDGSRSEGPGGKYDGSFVQDYGYVEGLGDLDECNGKFGKTPEYSDGSYHYFITENFPYKA